MAKEDKQEDKVEDDLKDVVVVVEGEPERKVESDKDDKSAKDDKDEERRPKGDEERDEDDERRAKKDEDEEDDKNLSEEERKKVRERRREERKLRKERKEAAERELALLRREVQELREKQTNTERRATSTEFQRIEAGINDSLSQMEEAKRLAAQALKEQNGEAHAEAMEAYYEARSRAEYLNRMKHGFLQQQEREQAQPKVDPMVASHARSWMAKNTWYDPRGGDEDSKIALAVDESMAAQGFDPRTPQYWDEFNKRLAKRLPHRVKLDKEDADDLDDDIDDRPSRTQGSGRERAAPGKTTYKLSAARVAAMKEAGVWDDPKERAKYIKRYMDYDKEASQKGA